MRKPAFVLAAALFGLLLRLGPAYRTATWPYELDYEEGNILNAGNRVAHDVTPYPAPQSFPYTLNPYGPVGYVLTAGAVRLFGLSLSGPRLLVMAAGIAVVLLIAGIVDSLGGDWRYGLLVGFWYLCTPILWAWFPLLRVDCWALAFSLAGLWLFAREDQRLFLASAMFACAALTKPTMVAAFGACAIELIVRGQRRKAAMLVGGFVVCGAAITAPWGSTALFHMLWTHPDPYDPLRFLQFYSVALAGALLAIAVVLWDLFGQTRQPSAPRLAWIYLSLASITALTSGKLGAGTNHLIEVNAALAITAGVILSRLRVTQDRGLLSLATGMLVLSVLSIASGWQRTVALAESSESQCRQAYEFIRVWPGNRVLSEDVAAVVLASKPVLLSNPFVYTQLRDRVRWSRGEIANLVEDQFFDLVVLGGDATGYNNGSGLWPPGVMAAIEKRYVPRYRFGCSERLGVVYLPADTASKIAPQ